jgi:hypothetical protein
MSIILKNAEIVLKLEKAGEKYRGSRFDWNGLVSSAVYKGVSFLGEEKPMFQRNPRLFGRGLHNEFGIKRCIGYDECEVGGWFPKIGTGWLKKDDKPYFFYTAYESEPLSFSCDVTDSRRAVFTCDSGERNGYAYRYTKEISLEGPRIRIHYNLENCGKKPLETDEYVHNFLCIGGKRMDAGCSVSFPWKLDSSRFTENVNPDLALAVEDSRVIVRGKAAGQFYLGGLSGGVTEHNGLAASWIYADERSKLCVSEKGSFVPSGVHLWGWKSVISPELFFSFKIEGGNSLSWERAFTVAEL